MIGHVEQLGFTVGPCLSADPVSHQPRFVAHLVGDAAGEADGSDLAWLCTDDWAKLRVDCVLHELRALAGTRLTHDHTDPVA